MTSRRLAFLSLFRGRRPGQLWISFPMLAVLGIRKLAPLVDYYKSIVSSIAKTGLSVPLSPMVLRRRRDLGLGEVGFNAEEARRIVEALGTARAAEGSE